MDSGWPAWAWAPARCLPDRLNAGDIATPASDRISRSIRPYVCYSDEVRRVRVVRSGRRHKIGNAHILAAMEAAGTPAVEGDSLIFVGTDDRGVELVIVAVPDDRPSARPGDLAVIHAMPTEF